MIREPDANAPDRVSTNLKSGGYSADLKRFQHCSICCGGSELMFMKSGYPIRKCLACGHHFAEIPDAQDHIERVYTDDYFNGAAGGYADYLASGRLLISHGRRYARILNRHMKPGIMLDVGAAAGFLLKGFEDMGWKGVGIEPNPGMAEMAQRRLGIMVETGTLESHQSEERYDLITMIQVVPHFVDPRQALEVATKMTKSGGYWLIETWNRDSWAARILGRSWHEYKPPSVLHWFSIQSLRGLVEGFGLREIARGRPMKWILPSHARAITQAQPGASIFGHLITGGMRMIPEKIPLPYVLGDVFWALFSKPGTEDVY